MSNIETKITNKIWKLFHKFENNGIADFSLNGEENFLDSVVKEYCGKKCLAFDIGANVGNYSDEIQKKFKEYSVKGEIHVFEPTKSCFQDLKRRFLKNNNIFLNNIGLSNEDKKAIIYYDKEESGLASLYQRDLLENNVSLSIEETIQLKKASKYIEEKKIKHINILKMDVEGHEMAVLEGFGKYLNSKFVDFIQFEYGGCNMDAKLFLRDYYRFFERKDFVIAKVMPKHLEIRDYNISMENFMYSNYVAVSKDIKYLNILNNGYILWPR